jgi:hypothetical protein
LSVLTEPVLVKPKGKYAIELSSVPVDVDITEGLFKLSWWTYLCS